MLAAPRDGAANDAREAPAVEQPPVPQVAYDADTLNAMLGQDDPLRMKLTHPELEAAKRIRTTIQGLRDFDNLNDFMYAQLAIICLDDVEDAVERAYALQAASLQGRVSNSGQLQ